MRVIFVDTNILIDFFADRKPFSISAAKLFTFSLSKKLKIYISAVSYNNIYYIVRQSLSHKQTIHLLAELSAMTEMIDVSKTVIDNAIASDFKDFEDAIQYHCALSVSKVEFIITRDLKDYKSSKIPVISAEEMVSVIEQE